MDTVVFPVLWSAQLWDMHCVVIRAPRPFWPWEKLSLFSLLWDSTMTLKPQKEKSATKDTAQQLQNAFC